MADIICKIVVTAITGIVVFFGSKDIIEQWEEKMDEEDADDEAYEIRKTKRRAKIVQMSKEDAKQLLFEQWKKGLI